MTWQCFLIVVTDRRRQWLRRYTNRPSRAGEPQEWTCAAGWHEARAKIEDGPLEVTPEGHYIDGSPPHSHADPRWPTRCDSCDYEFTEADEWQRFTSAIYRRPETGEEFVLRDEDLPIGAMWDCPWFRPEWQGPDGRSLSVMTPGGIWGIDCPARGGGRWSRTGEPPIITVSPSIDTGTYHGFLQNGVLTADLAGRTYPERGPRRGGGR